MKVLFLTEFYPTSTAVDVRGGVEVRTYYTSQALAESHDVTVAAVREEGMQSEQKVGKVRVLRPGPVATFRQAGGYLSRWRFGRAARQTILREQPDLVIAENFLAYAVMLTMSAAWRKKTYLTYHDVWVGEWVRNVGLAMGLVGEVIERLVFRSTWRGYIANSETTKHKLITQNISDKDVTVIPNGVNLQAIQEIAPEHFERPTILTVARLVKYKRIDDLIRALPVVRKSIPNVQLVIIGTGPEEKKWKKLAQVSGVQDAVIWRGFVKEYRDVLAAIKGADVFSLPSAVEGFGFVTLEAMACGTPYVSSDISPTREITEGGMCGTLVPVGDIGQYETQLTMIVERKLLSHQIYTPLVSKYDWSVILPTFIKTVNSYRV